MLPMVSMTTYYGMEKLSNAAIRPFVCLAYDDPSQLGYNRIGNTILGVKPTG